MACACALQCHGFDQFIPTGTGSISMTEQAAARRPRPRVQRLMAAALTLGAVGALAAAAPPQPGEQQAREHHGFREIDLVSDIPGRAEATDPNLGNPWGLVTDRAGELLVADNHTDKATTYSGGQKGKPVRILDRVVSFPTDGAPTGVVRNDGDDFEFSAFGRTGPARFLFAGEHGDLFAYNPDVSGTDAIPVAHEDSDSETAIFKGLELIKGDDRDGKDAKHEDRRHERGEPSVLVANFRDARVDVFDEDFNLVPPNGAFRDSGLPAGYAPFNIKEIDSKVFVTYALQDADKEDDVAGPGNGFIDVFSTEGKLLKRFASQGVLNAPWGLEVAPKGFGKFAGDLLVGNFGDGRINVFDRHTGKPKGHLEDREGNPIEIPGLWGLQRGTDKSGGRESVWFAAGINDEENGLLGVLRAEH
ncbi:TIGR03118 family protein [Streptomyces sp. NPDC058290]|uniref:TIGR03118 family protein n=1 Tax=Streptomyces sp. NPDC058290 TaxID=3346426 RepID=UPI0036E13719